MEYVHGESLWTLLRMTRAQGRSIPVRVGCALIASVLHGLHAAHDACDDTGEPLHIVHRDVSPQNILIGSDGIPRVLDFGIAKALGRLRTTPQGEIKGKLGYIAQEQLHAEKVDRRTDVYGAAAVLWEVLTGAPLFDGPSEPAIVHRVLYEVVQAPSRSRAEVPAALDAIVLRALSRDPAARHETAQQMALQIERDVGLATQSEVAAWLYDVAGARLAERAQLLAALQEGSASQRLQSAEVSSSTRKIEPGAAATKLAPAPTLIKPVESANGAKRSRRGLKIASAVALSVVCALALFAAWQARPVVTAPRPPLTAASNAMATVAATQESLEQPVTSQPPAAESAPAPNAEKPKLLRAVKRTKPTNPAPPARSVPSKTTPDDKHCALFYDVDANGIRRPKPECL
jgi:serine/threonine-protein kinase